MENAEKMLEKMRSEKDLGSRYVIISKYEPESDLLTVTFRDNERKLTRFSVKKLNGIDRTQVEEQLYQALGCQDTTMRLTAPEMRRAGIGDFACYIKRFREIAA